MIRIKKGLDLPLNGAPKQVIESGKRIKSVAITGSDYKGMKPTLLVKEGEKVKLGQAVFECKKVPGVVYTAPASGTIRSINRGKRRVFQTMVFDLDGEGMDQVEFKNYKSGGASSQTFDSVSKLLQESGLWTALRTRPFSKSPACDGTKPNSLFITAMDTNPHAPEPEVVIKESSDAFCFGVEVLSHLSEGKTFICQKAGADIPKCEGKNIEVHEFSGVHPAGNVGTHIHHLDPVHISKSVWHIGYQDVIAVGKLFQTGKLNVERVISVAGPLAKNPRLIRTRFGACLTELLEGEAIDGPVRQVSGSVLNGHKVDDVYSYLGHFHNQASLLEEDNKREFLGWHAPGMDRFSLKRTFLSKLIPGKKFDMTSTTWGSPRAMVPVGLYEAVMPLDILPTQLLRAVLTHDTDNAQALGCLELDEEDLALCTFADPGKTDFGPYLRETLKTIEKEG
jgi:Na+-transporting NADH:ubiquinone oxidoreductase subunit A